MRKAVFLDRDWVINEEVDSLHKLEDLKLIPWSAEWIKLLNEKDFLVIVISNQSAIAKWILTIKWLNEINEEIKRRIEVVWWHIDDIYYCPHYPNYKKWYIKELCIECDCRKPKTKLINEAIKKYDIDRKSSYMIWDSTRDILSWENAWLKTIMVETGYGGKDWKYDIIANWYFNNLLEACNFIIKK